MTKLVLSKNIEFQVALLRKRLKRKLLNWKQNILSMKAHLLETWGMRDNPPFRGVPPRDIQELIQLFVDRDEEIQRAILTLDDGENILIRGMTGIGKTAFIIATLYQMEHEAEALGAPILPIHIRQFVGGSREEFYRVVLYSLAKQLGPRLKRAREIVNALTGEKITRGRSRGLSVGLEVQVPQLLAAKGGSEIGGDESRLLTIDNPEHFLDELLDSAIKKRVIDELL